MQVVRIISSKKGDHLMAGTYLKLAPVLLLLGGIVHADDSGIKRTKSGKPDFTGNYDAGTLTPLDRPEYFGDKKFMSREEAEKVIGGMKKQLEFANRQSSPERGAPVKGGDGRHAFGAGGVGGYNAFWVDPGSDAFEIDGKFRTSIVYDPPNGRQPPMTMAGMLKMAKNFASFAYTNDGTASWLTKDGPGPFDGPEYLALAERCLLGFSGGPPMIPSLYNNFNRISQTEDHVVILLEMVHDARIIRLNSEHNTNGFQKWLGDSIGWWEGDTLVIDTINFRDRTGLAGGDENLHIIEKLSKLENGDILYGFTVDDPTAWTATWSGEYIWKSSKERVYEYACHEGNYAMGNILRGARILESDFIAEADGSE
tara:strand:- start:5808 stop:6914 length:1107 start_codon:yes stop_codon:yes gene_type:complete